MQRVIYAGVLEGFVCTHITHSHTHTLTHAFTLLTYAFCALTHSHTHTLTQRLSPKFYDDIIRLPIPINNACVLMMIGVLPTHPSLHVLFVR